jgi:aryl-alcohol dehydrogenase-like predicted oxidoreductase
MSETPRTVRLGTAELARIGLGTNRLTNTAANRAFIQAAVEAGVQMIDTAHLYTGGESERTIGEALSPLPDGVVVATKGGYGGAGRGKPDVLRAEIEQSLRSLRTDRIALWYLHRVDPETPIEDSLAVAVEYRDRGVIEHVGISEVDIEQIRRAREVVPIAAVQNHYNSNDRQWEAVVDYCTQEEILFVPFYPLRGAASTTDALRWLLQRSPVTLPIPGTLSIGHLQENLSALD